MFVSRKKHEVEMQAVNDRLDIALANEERLLALLKLAITHKEKPSKPEVIPSSEPLTERPPAVVMAAIKATFPGDAGIYAANYTYAMSQRHRWEDHAEDVANEIVTGRT